MTPRISVITPSYNQAAFLEDTLRSVLTQNYPELEYIVIDGGSSDASVDIIRKYEHELAWWVSEKDKGQADAVNKGFLRATGDIVGWLNSDDIYLPDTLKRVADYFERYKDADVIYGNHVVTDQSNNPLWVKKELPFSIRRLEHHSYMSQPATFIRRSAIERMGLLDEDLYFLLDWEYFIRLGKACRFRHVPEVFATYRLHRIAKTAVQAGQKKFAEEKARVIARHSHNPSRFATVNSLYHRLWYAASFLARAFVVLRSNPINFIKYVRYKRAGYG